MKVLFSKYFPQIFCRFPTQIFADGILFLTEELRGKIRLCETLCSLWLRAGMPAPLCSLATLRESFHAEIYHFPQIWNADFRGRPSFFYKGTKDTGNACDFAP